MTGEPATRGRFERRARVDSLRLLLVAAMTVGAGAVPHAQTASTAPVIVVETTRGTFEIETYPDDAPKTVAHVLDLARSGFYDGQRLHRVVPGVLIQWGDPRSRDLSRRPDWGFGAEASSDHPIGVAEITSRRPLVKGAVGVAHPGLPTRADSQIFVVLSRRQELDGRYAVFGHIVKGADVPETLQVEDVITRVSVRP